MALASGRGSGSLWELMGAADCFHFWFKRAERHVNASSLRVRVSDSDSAGAVVFCSFDFQNSPHVPGLSPSEMARRPTLFVLAAAVSLPDPHFQVEVWSEQAAISRDL